MKRKGALLCAAAALAVLINASVWEGAASGSSGTDLPETGYYVATNSFPRNTVVDITNLENGKTVRAIVSAPLENPGLLAVLSRDAASAIGLPNRSIGRVRMNQPADPVAFSRFTEGRTSSGDPDHDPAAFVEANGAPPEAAGEAAPPPAAQAPAASVTDSAPPAAGTGVVIAGVDPVPAEPAEAAPPPTEEAAPAETVPLAAEAAEPAEPVETAPVEVAEAAPAEAGEAAEATEAVPPGEDPAAAAETGALAAGAEPAGTEAAPSGDDAIGAGEETAIVSDETGTESPEDLTIVDLPEPYIPPASTTPDEGITPETNPELVWVPGEETGDEALIEPEPADMAEVTDSIIPGDSSEDVGLTEASGGVFEPDGDMAEETPAPDEERAIFSGDYDLTLIPSEERPPESPEPDIPDDLIVSSGAGTGPVPETPSLEGEGASPVLPPPADTAGDTAGDYGFSVPVITELETGKYYLQLAASRNQDAVKTELAKLTGYWPLKVQVNERDRYPYRILVGPVNLGESSALLQRFKGSYQGAFVRQGN
jgi:hypothetical protein